MEMAMLLLYIISEITIPIAIGEFEAVAIEAATRFCSPLYPQLPKSQVQEAVDAVVPVGVPQIMITTLLCPLTGAQAVGWATQ